MQEATATTENRRAPAGASGTLHREIEAARLLLTLHADILGDDAELRADTIEGSTNLLEALRPALARIIECETMSLSLREAEKRMANRRHRLEAQAQDLRMAVQLAMELGERKKYETDIGVLSLRPSPRALEVLDESAIPSEFWERADPSLDKRKLIAALKVALAANQTIPGAALTEPGQTLHIDR
jgi:hypothetical protein